MALRLVIGHKQQRAQPAQRDRFGTGLEVDLPALLSELRGDPVKRCLHRIFWPLDQSVPPERAEDYRGRHPAQIHFLNRLFFTLSLPDVLNLQVDLGWVAFRREASSRILLRRLLCEEENCSAERAEDWVEQALERSPAALLQMNLGVAGGLWKVGQHDRACDYLRQTLEIYADEGCEIGWLAWEGDRLAGALDADKVAALRALARALKGYLRPSILESWEAACQDWQKRQPRPASPERFLNQAGYQAWIDRIRSELPHAQTVMLAVASDSHYRAVAMDGPYSVMGAGLAWPIDHGLLKHVREFSGVLMKDTEHYGLEPILMERGFILLPTAQGLVYVGGPPNSFNDADRSRLAGVARELSDQLR